MPIYSENKKARFDYEILDTYTAGIILSGQEVKSVKSGHMSLKGSYVTFFRNEAILTNANITKYKFAGNLEGYDPTQSRKLLLKKKEIRYLRGKSEEKGLTIVPLKVYSKNRLIKIEIAVARGKKLYDKKETLKQRDTEREIRRSLK